MAKLKKVSKKGSKRKISILSKIAANSRQIQKNKDALIRTGERLFGQAVRQIFRKFPALENFGWRQYTPGWNDGDACTFGCYFEPLLVNGEETGVYELQHIRELLSGDLKKKRTELEQELKATKEDWKKDNIKSKIKYLDLDPSEVEKKHLMVAAVTDLLEALDESVFEHMFGEGEVTVSREGTTVEPCEHD